MAIIAAAKMFFQNDLMRSEISEILFMFIVFDITKIKITTEVYVVLSIKDISIYVK